MRCKFSAREKKLFIVFSQISTARARQCGREKTSKDLTEREREDKIKSNNHDEERNNKNKVHFSAVRCGITERSLDLLTARKDEKSSTFFFGRNPGHFSLFPTSA